MNVWLLIVIATLGYAAFQFFSAKAGGKIDGGLVPVIVNLVGVFAPLALLLGKIMNKGQLLPTQRTGMIYAILAGFSIAAFAVAFHKIFQHGGNLSVVSPLIFGGAIALSTLLSLIFLKETVSAQHILGIVLVFVGLALISLARVR